MIKLTKIDEHIEVYRDKKVVIWGTGDFGRKLYHVFEYFKVDVIAFCDNNEQKWGSKINDICIISPSELKEKLSKDDTIVIRIAMHPGNQYILMPQINELGLSGKLYFDKIDLLSEEFEVISQCIIKIKNIKQNPDIIKLSTVEINKLINRQSTFDYISKNIDDDLLFICSCPKTGDVTLSITFIKNNIKYNNIWHDPEIFRLYDINNLNKKIKIVTGIREPIIVEISALYHVCSKINDKLFDKFILNGINKKDYLETLFLDGCNVQHIYDEYYIPMKYNQYMASSSDKHDYMKEKNSLMQTFIYRLKENIGIDITEQPFDKEKGYSIIKKDNVEVFVYQLEKMNDCVKELAEFVGGNFTKLEIGNVAADKWIADSYKQAQKEIKIPKENLEKWLSEPFIQHFYSEEDIQKFKLRWRHLLKNN